MDRDSVSGGRARYRAFISYSHKDSGFGRKLHRRLEAYALPRRLVGRLTAQGPAPARLAPIFRDREEFSAAHDLTEQVRNALAESGALVVVCSPAAAASPWVAREIELFRSLHPDRPVLAALIEGEPTQAFPETLRLGPDGAAIEPLAADFRPAADGARQGLLKLVAGILGIGLDELVQRDAQRNLRRVTAVTVGALTVAVAMGVTAIEALNARAEAERQRVQAEGLTQFMETDLRDRLRSVGRLEVMTAANRRALKYYDDRGLDRLSGDALGRRARVLQAIGEDDIEAKSYDEARRRLSEADGWTRRLLSARPADPERIFNQGQSEYWLGKLDYDIAIENRDLRPLNRAKSRFLAYKTLADRLVELDPSGLRSQREAGYAEGNVCAVAYVVRDYGEALRACGKALDHIQRVYDRLKGADGSDLDLANLHGWFADVCRDSHDGARALEHRLAEEALLAEAIKRDSKNIDLRFRWAKHLRARAGLASDAGRRSEARAWLRNALAILDDMIPFDRDNKVWAKQRAEITRGLTELSAPPKIQTSRSKPHG
jgi:tetratricopeptide (TPR) repeat protein